MAFHLSANIFGEYFRMPEEGTQCMESDATLVRVCIGGAALPDLYRWRCTTRSVYVALHYQTCIGGAALPGVYRWRCTTRPV